MYQQRFGQTGLHGLAFGQALAQVGAQAAQGGDAGDDAGLFGEGWERKGQPRHLLRRYVWHPVAPTRVDSANEQVRLKPKLQELRR